MSKLGGSPETLWDDISFHYSRDSYTLIYRIENLMRKLIANFMLVTVGAEWIVKSAPREIKEAISKSKRKEYLNVLHTIDFIQLADFLLRPYSTCIDQDIIMRLRKAETAEELGELKSLVPQSNWSRYFSSLVECNDEYLQKRWNDLYKLRCKVAHNAIVTKTDYDETRRLAEELAAKLEDAIKKLPQVKVPAAEVEQVAEDAASRISNLMGEFVASWRTLEEHVLDVASRHGEKTKDFKSALEVLHKNGVLHGRRDRALRLRQLRNHVVHPTGVTVSPQQLERALSEIRDLIEVVSVGGNSGTGAPDKNES
jgi:hypothetical protein